MLRKIVLLFTLFFASITLTWSNSAKIDTLVLVLAYGNVEITLDSKLAPKNVERVKKLAEEGSYDGVVFHRVIDGFMAQTGDVQFGNIYGYNDKLVGSGVSDYANLPAEFSDKPFKRGVVAMARSSDVNSANAQFFICFGDAPWLNGQYTIIGEVTKGMKYIDQLRKGNTANNGAVIDPDHIIKAYLK
ncbi:peptidylprolyl isomerase [Bartonella sp. DGB1]|uniref:peptidylprolyl isomerase n=1 Tax=Bartonella sp. DGB1 TaxID=3239807 RepID=UPI0035243D3A